MMATLPFNELNVISVVWVISSRYFSMLVRKIKIWEEYLNRIDRKFVFGIVVHCSRRFLK